MKIRHAQQFRLLTLTTLLLAAGFAHAAGALPEGGQVVAGSGSISRQGQTLTVQQAGARLAVDWQSFSVGAGNTVRFVQPSASAVALNRVTGTEASVVQGAIQSNGQVFLLNPNGILFSPTARVQVGGLLASTLKLDPADFMAGRYRLSGDSTQAIVNQGLLQVSTGGSVALVAARIENTGQIAAPQGQVLMAAGRTVRIDLGGPVPIEVEEGALHATIEQNGAIRADGGRVYLTAKAAGDLASAAINHRGITEARTLATGEQGEIWLMGDMAHGAVQVDGRLDASAPDGSHGGFIETSAAKVRVADTAQVSTLAANGHTGTWLIDPADYVIAATGGDITGALLASALASNNVTIQSGSGAAGSSGDIHVNDAVRWTSAKTLTLNAWRDIHINADISASDGTLVLYYGQGALNNATTAVNPSRVHINNGAVISLSAGQHFRTRLGTDGEETAWTVITALGNADSNDDGTLQGINGRLSDGYYVTGNYVLGADIDASTTRSWNDGKGFMPLGLTNLRAQFAGRFDGLGHTVSGLYINRPDESFVGFFSLTDPNGGAFSWNARGRPTDNPQVANVGLLNVDITAGGTVGAFAGELRESVVQNVYATGTVRSSGGRVGGLVGNNKYGVLLNAYSTVDVSGSGGTGGLVGEFEGTAYITNSYAAGTVTRSDAWASNVGGLIGSLRDGVVAQSYFDTSVNTDATMEDRASYGRSSAELATAVGANWSPAVWRSSGTRPTLKRYTVIPVYGQPVEGQSDPGATPAPPTEPTPPTEPIQPSAPVPSAQPPSPKVTAAISAVQQGAASAPVQVPLPQATTAVQGGAAASGGQPGGSGGLRLVAVTGELDGGAPSGGVDPLGFMRVFVVNGGLRLP